MPGQLKTAFFDYYNRAIGEGLTPTEAYHWAITEDLYDAEDVPITAEEATADGMCYHPQFAVERFFGHESWRDHICGICGLVLWPWINDGPFTGWFYVGRPVKIPTRRETLVTFLSRVTNSRSRRRNTE